MSRLSGDYAHVRAEMLERLRDQPALAGLRLDDEENWIAALGEAWAALAEVVGFYQQRVEEEAFLATARRASSVRLIYESLGHQFPPHGAARTTIAYHLSAKVAGVDAVGRARATGGAGAAPEERARRRAGEPPAAPDDPVAAPGAAGAPAAGTPAAGTPAAGAPAAGAPAAGAPAAGAPAAGAPAAGVPASAAPGVVGTPAGISTAPAGPAAPASDVGVSSQIPPAAEVRAIPAGGGRPPVFVTLAPLGAYVGASRLKVGTGAGKVPPAIGPKTTLIELAGTRTGLAVGEPVLIAATTAAGAVVRWVRVLTGMTADARRKSTRVVWDVPLGSAPGDPSADGVSDPVVTGFATSSSMVAADAPAWSSLTLEQQLATRTDAGERVPVRGGLGRSADGGATWTGNAVEGLPPAASLTAVATYGDVTIVAAGAAGLYRAEGTGSFSPVSLGGGARRPVGFLSPTSMLAGAAGGTVYQSLDDGQTWTPVSGSGPTFADVPADKRAKPPAPASRLVASGQLPSATVRAVIEDPAATDNLLAGTDAGLFQYAGGRWQAVSVDDPLTPVLGCGVLALTVVPGTSASDSVPAAATPDGVYLRQSGADWQSSLARPAQALAVLDGTLYAACDDEVWVNSGSWQQTGQGIPAGTRVNALLAAQDTLFAATARGIYQATGSGAAMTWTRRDRAPALTVPRSAFEPPVDAAEVPPGLVGALAAYGVVVGPGAGLVADEPGWLLEHDDYRWLVEPTEQTWNLTLCHVLDEVSSLAIDATGALLAAGGPVTSVAADWPGFAVTGNEVEIAPPVRKLATRLPALIEQRTAQPASRVLDVTGIEQETVTRAGRRTALTRIAFDGDPLEAGQFPRSSSTVWTGAVTLPLFDPAPATVPLLSGKTITLASQLAAPVDPGRLATVTGAPPALTVAPLGGVTRILPDGKRGSVAGAAQTDVRGIEIGDDGTAHLATDEGVLEVAPGAHAELLTAGWPSGPATAVARAGTTVLAASGKGILQLVPAGSGAPASFEPAGLAGAPVALLAAGSSGAAAATGDDLVHVSSSPAVPDSWTATAPLPEAAVQLAVDGSRVYAATAGAVLALQGRRWQSLSGGSPPDAVSCLQVAGGVLWAGSPGGLFRFDPGASGWRRDPGVTGPVQAICLTVTSALVVAAAGELLLQRSGGWTRIGPTGNLAGALAAPADGSYWVGARALLPLAVAVGAAPLQLSHAQLLSGVPVQTRDVQALAQGAVPDVLLAAFADSGLVLDASKAVVADAPDGGWTIRVTDQLYVVTLRHAGGARAVDVHRSQAPLYPIGVPTRHGGIEAWPVEVSGQPATVTAPSESIVHLPAGPDAPALAENAVVAASGAGDSGATVGAATVLTLQADLTHVYDASTVQVNLNVVPAAQGQPVSLPIGSGDPQQAHQTMTVPGPIAALPQGPSAQPASSLRVYVAGHPYSEVPSLQQSGPHDAVYVAQHAADGAATVTFGDGVNGTRLPAGRDNVVATFVRGGGPAGEVAAGTLIQPLARQQLVRAVHNPLGAIVPAQPRPAAARNAAVCRLDRVVTLLDYVDLARSLAGVADAAADVVASPTGRAVVVTLALEPSAPEGVPEQVRDALGAASASGLPVRVALALPAPVSAQLRVAGDPAVKPGVQAALGGLRAPRPGERLTASRVIAAAARVEGVEGATLVAWGRTGERPQASEWIHARRAVWSSGLRAPLGAELLTLDPSELAIAVEGSVVPA